MSRITLDTKCRLCRSCGDKLYLKGARCFTAKCPLEKKGAVPPGMHGIKNMKKPTDYGLQLRAKQKAKRIYGVQETQFKNLYLQAKRLKGLVGDNFLVLLERRLDNVVYCAGLALSRSHAKQLISHKQVLVNGKPLSTSSYLVKKSDVVSLDSKTATLFADGLKMTEKDFKSPAWIELDKKNSTAKIISLPVKDEIQTGVNINLIVEYYSR